MNYSHLLCVFVSLLIAHGDLQKYVDDDAHGRTVAHGLTRTLALRERETHNFAGASDGVRCLVPLIALSIHSINIPAALKVQYMRKNKKFIY